MSYFNAEVGTTAKMLKMLSQGTLISFQRFCKFLVFPQWQYYIFYA